MVKRSSSPSLETSTSLQAFSSLISRAATLYSDIPTYGNILTTKLAARDYQVDFSPYPFTDVEYVFDGSYRLANGTSATAEIGTSYRVLLRCVVMSSALRGELC
jgi:hypothetical protein